MKQFLFFLCFFLSTSGWSQSDSLVLKRLKAHVSFLASDSLMGRLTGSPSEKIANAYVKNNWLKHRRVTFLDWNYSIVQSTDTLHSQMIGCFINRHASSTVLIGAHIDHIGFGGPLSKSHGKTAVHNGADDNASGVALLIELQRYLALQKLPFNVLLVPYTGHEIGTYGSGYLKENWSSEYGVLAAVINFDMIGKMDTTSHTLFVSSRDSLFQRLPATTGKLHLHTIGSDRIQVLDTKHFLGFPIPIYSFTTGMHDDYHRISDKSVYINYNGMLETLHYFQQWLGNEAYQKALIVPTTATD